MVTCNETGQTDYCARSSSRRVCASLLISWHPGIGRLHRLSSRCTIIVCVSSQHLRAPHPHATTQPLPIPQLNISSPSARHQPQNSAFNLCVFQIKSSRCCIQTPQIPLSSLINTPHPRHTPSSTHTTLIDCHLVFIDSSLTTDLKLHFVSK